MLTDTWFRGSGWSNTKDIESTVLSKGLRDRVQSSGVCRQCRNGFWGSFLGLCVWRKSCTTLYGSFPKFGIPRGCLRIVKIITFWGLYWVPPTNVSALRV